MVASRSLGRLSLFDYTFRVRARLHRFLLLLLILTLPVQALAYAGMQACMGSDRGAAEQMMMPGETMAMADCHTTPAHPHPPAQHECKFCAACALASALPVGFAGNTPVVPVVHSFAMQPAPLFSGFIPDGPDRPPRTSLA